MKKIRLLLVEFENELKPHQVSAFRGAIIEKAGRENILFHNHLSETSYLYGYPVIQYKSIRGKAGILCIDYGVDDIHHLFSSKSSFIHLGDKELDLKVSRLQMDQYNLNVWNKKFRYNISNWIALTEDNYSNYMSAAGVHERNDLFRRILIGNIISFAKGVKWQIEKEIVITIEALRGIKTVKFKDQKMLSFNLDFSCNVFLPPHIGLGKGVSRGFGTIHMLREKDKYENQ